MILNIINLERCITNHFPSQASVGICGESGETRLVDLSLDIPASTCSGTYDASGVVKNSSGRTLASASTKFTAGVVSLHTSAGARIAAAREEYTSLFSDSLTLRDQLSSCYSVYCIERL